MTPAGLITRLEGHHSRTNMLSTAELYNLLPAILSALRGMEAAREALDEALAFMDDEGVIGSLPDQLREALAALSQEENVGS